MFAFEWDEEKSQRNFDKHGVTFPESSTTFYDPLGIELLDEAHSEDEERWIRLAMSMSARLLVTVFVERQDRIRIISSREATAHERRTYEEGV